MSRTSSVFARVEPEVKTQAEAVLNELGIPMSNAIGLFLRQVILQRGIPFEMKLPRGKLLSYDDMDKTDFDREISNGFEEAEEGKVFSAKQAADIIRREYRT